MISVTAISEVATRAPAPCGREEPSTIHEMACSTESLACLSSGDPMACNRHRCAHDQRAERTLAHTNTQPTRRKLCRCHAAFSRYPREECARARLECARRGFPRTRCRIGAWARGAHARRAGRVHMQSARVWRTCRTHMRDALAARRAWNVASAGAEHKATSDLTQTLSDANRNRHRRFTRCSRAPRRRSACRTMRSRTIESDHSALEQH